jgi:SPP1 family phage portal protein
MLHVLTYPRQKYDEANLDKQLILKLITKHRDIIAEKLAKNKRYYDGEHDICNKQRDGNAPNAKTVCNHAKDISDTASGYFMGNAISYNCGMENAEATEKLLNAFDNAQVDDVDSDNSLDMSVYGVAYEYVFVREDEAELSVRTLQPEFTFIVYDDSIEQKELFGVYYCPMKNDADNEVYYVATVLTEKHKYVFELHENGSKSIVIDKEPKEHNLGYIPIIEYKNNKDNIGDFEQQISLIDAYNTLMADRVNDKEQFIDAVLVIYGAILGDDAEETVEAKKKLKDLKLLELPLDAKAEYLARTLDETGVETLRKALKEDIYTFSHVPNLTDEHFVGNSSGVAMEYKLLGLEMITKIKERYYKKGLRKRISIFCHFLNIKEIVVDPNSIVPVFSRALPKNMQELANLVTTLKGSVSMRTLLQLLPFVESPEDEEEAVKKESEENVKKQKEMFGIGTNTPPEEDDVDE